MAKTVVGLFDTWEEAEAARDRLITDGFSAGDIQLKMHPAASGEAADHGTMDAVRNFFYDLFGGEHVDAGPYAEAIRRGGAVVAVMQVDEDRLEMTRNSLLAAGAVDLEKRTTEWRAEGFRDFDPAAKPYSATEIEEKRRSQQPVVGDREIDPNGVRVYASPDLEPERQRRYREHFRANFAGLGEYADFHPAYLYGYSLHSDPAYVDRPWNLMEADARSDWERQHPVGSWDKFKAAIRFGWDSIKT